VAAGESWRSGIDDPEMRAWVAEAQRRRIEEHRLMDFSTAPRPRLRWFFLRKRYESQWAEFWREHQAWYASQQAALGLPALPSEDDCPESLGELESNPALDAAMHRISDAKGIRGMNWSASQPEVIHVVLDPYKARYARRVRELGLPFDVRVKRRDG
jgi:hypothetical protein